MNMKKKNSLIFGLGIIIGLAVSFFLNGSTAIGLPFTGSDIEKIKMYHYEGVPAEEQCKIITEQEDIDTLYKEFQNIKVRDKKKDTEPMTGGSVTRFVFVLSDGNEYDLDYYNPGSSPSLTSKAGDFEYQTSVNLERYWTTLDYELVEKEPKMLSIDEYNEKYSQKVHKEKMEWSIQEIEALFLDNAEPEWKLIRCVSVYDFAYDRVGAVLYTEDDTGYVNVAFIDENGIMPHCGIEAAFDENPELTYHGNGEVTFNVCSKDGVKYKQKIVFSKCDDQVNFISESLE